MIWAAASVALGLLMTVLVIAELRQQPVGNAFKIFVAVTFTVAFVYGMLLLAAKVFT